MNVIDRIANLGRIARQEPDAPRPTASETLNALTADLERVIEGLRSAIEAQQRAEALEMAEQSRAVELAERAGCGELDDPAELAAALQAHRKAAADLNRRREATDSAQALVNSINSRMHDAEQQAAKEAYSAACLAYARACAPLPELAKRVRDLAPAAGVLLNEVNSPHLIGRAVTIGGALVDIPAQA